VNVQKLRIEKGFTVQQLADLSGLSKRTLEEIIRRDKCTVDNAIKIADALEVTLDELCRTED
jgi:transcriptional regulator with XRE-family HTH domain